eukprot:gnl/TRDRNA2_/TRDRNA2_55063_c0_seq1.p1 gnl/TRDRNA2_/TRDRNA2_55063_c0~~gnl/TRDRNA2_/TRDRNA2_55063_c0_seq1.p1  ORF type:complete len:463 (+),score=83.01 gnl/TRDRNA2_/TRDRNA2_55063_c0_seq1:65-1453(+)
MCHRCCEVLCGLVALALLPLLRSAGKAPHAANSGRDRELLLASLANTTAGLHSENKLSDRAFRGSLYNAADLDATTLGKASHIATPRQRAPPFREALPVSRQRVNRAQRWPLSLQGVHAKQPVMVRAYDREFALNGDERYRGAEEVAQSAVAAAGGQSPISGRLVLITGANSGIGKQTARVLGTVCGAKVLLACRTAESAAETAAELTRELESASGDFTPVLHPVDLSSQKCVREASDFILKNHLADKPLDRLICNAGLAGVPGGAVTEDGHEIHFGVNHLGHFTFVNSLLDSVKGSDEGRVLIVASETHRLSTLNLTDLMASEVAAPMAPFVRYGRSKLANILFAQELSRRLAAFRNTSVYALCPGLINSGLGRYGRDTPEGAAQQDKMFENAAATGLLKSVDEGAASSVFLATAEKEKLAESGTYYTNCIPLKPSDIADDRELALKLWEFSEKLTGTQFQ